MQEVHQTLDETSTLYNFHSDYRAIVINHIAKFDSDIAHDLPCGYRCSQGFINNQFRFQAAFLPTGDSHINLISNTYINGVGFSRPHPFC